jgi:hypothetical protein
MVLGRRLLSKPTVQPRSAQYRYWNRISFGAFAMTDFALELRHRCRNPKCRSKLPKPVENERLAFCTRGCFTSFYRQRCLVCQQPFKRKRENQHICGRPSCKPTFWGNRKQFDPNEYLGTPSARVTSKTSIKPGIKTAHEPEKPWRIVAGGQPITAGQYHCATVPDGPDCQWRDGECDRLEARNSALLRRSASC